MQQKKDVNLEVLKLLREQSNEKRSLRRNAKSL